MLIPPSFPLSFTPPPPSMSVSAQASAAKAILLRHPSRSPDASTSSASLALEALNPTPRPATCNISASEGQWLVKISDAPPPSNGRLGPLPLYGRAVQTLDAGSGTYSNLLTFGPFLRAELFASFEAVDDDRLKVTFERIEFEVFGQKVAEKRFPEGTTRIWCLTYVDETVRVVRAGAAGGLVNGERSEMKEDEYYFFMTKVEEGVDKESEVGGENEEQVLVGSADYYKGFLEQPLRTDLTERDPMGG
eukprot:CAMPEP_0182483850 /NCGR_PEP_ID=MMETSP1319-20130603/42236_1 /TAXON_ID=172717 /ORGANISM="Bolidomonas pacifica, Strain RCC208" /LENGTH=247 /DNA_ID=CAMNT_0024685695 /DNA_START=158 /DNA_END=898 /DNA_ORIENTATION=+